MLMNRWKVIGILSHLFQKVQCELSFPRRTTYNSYTCSWNLWVSEPVGPSGHRILLKAGCQGTRAASSSSLCLQEKGHSLKWEVVMKVSVWLDTSQMLALVYSADTRTHTGLETFHLNRSKISPACRANKSCVLKVRAWLLTHPCGI